MELTLENSQTISIDLDIVKDWKFLHEGKTYELNVNEFLRLLKLIKEKK